MRPPKAFTVRDLVALLCLAALALPILAATLQGTIDLSVAERCKANLASLTRCVLAYAAQNRGYMPVYWHRSTSGYIRAPPNTYKSYVAFSAMYGTYPVTGLCVDARNFGLPYTRGLFHPPELLYCPSPFADNRSKLSYYPKPWGSGAGPGSSFIRVGYMWNPWVMPVPTAPDRWTYEDRLLLSRHPRERFLVCDLMDRGLTISHPLPNSAFWNMGYPDGHVAPLASQALYDLFATGFDANSDWALFNEHVRPLILLPAGP